MKQYSSKWVLDPLHWWSRSYEYTYHLQQLEKYLKPNIKSVADLGAGTDFFSWYLPDKLNISTTAVDFDPKNGIFHQEINGKYTDSNKKTNFIEGSLQNLPLRDNSFDLVFCVSVLEHTDDYNKIMNEISRIMKKDGVFILTFDVSLDGSNSIPVKEAKELLQVIEKYFIPANGNRYSMEIPNDTFTTSSHYNQLSYCQWRKCHGSWYKPNLTFYSSTWKKKS